MNRKLMVSISLGAALAMQLGACGAKPDAVRTVRAYEFATCSAEPSTAKLDIEAAEHFQALVAEKYFVRDRDVLTAVNHESDAAASGLRQYRGPFFTYLHPRQLTDKDRELQIDWAGMVFLHAEGVRTRVNGAEFGEWRRVRTRNFADQARGVEGLPRWICLKNAEIAWAELTHVQGIWRVKPQAVSVFESEDDLQRLLPLATAAQIAGTEKVEPKTL